MKDISPFEPLELHEKWREWYQDEFRRYFKADDLASGLKGKGEYEKAQEVTEYISILRRYYVAFIEFLDSLNS